MIRFQVDLGGVKYDSFVVPSCKDCEAQGIKDSIVKPNVVFFGETISEAVKDRAVHMVAQSTGVLVMGTSLATYSAFRFVSLLFLGLARGKADQV